MSDIQEIGVLEEKQFVEESIFKEIMAMNISNMMKDTNPQVP